MRSSCLKNIHSAVLHEMANIAQMGGALWDNQATAVRLLRADHHCISVGVGVGMGSLSGHYLPGHYLGKALF